MEPRLTSTDDVRWAFKVLRCQEPPAEQLMAIQRRFRTLADLRGFVLQTQAFRDGTRKQRCDKVQLDEEHVRWAYRLLRFVELDPDECRRIASSGQSAMDLVDGLLATHSDAATLAEVAPRAKGAQVVFSKSMPRSGHHLLASMLLDYFGRDLAYCEFYGQDCCRRQPCERAYVPLLDNRFFLQKSHDFALNDPFVEDALYIVQYRHPIPRLQSNWDHFVHVRGAEDTLEGFRKFAKVETDYYIRFTKRWIEKPPVRSLTLSYESLTSQTRGALAQAIEFINPDEPLDKGAFSRALAIARKPAASSLQDKSSEFVPRDPEAYRHQSLELYRSIEMRVIAACPRLQIERCYSAA